MARPTAIAAAGEHGHGGRGRGDARDEPTPTVGGGLGPDLAQGAVQHQVTVGRPVQQGLRRHLAEQIGHGGQVLQVAPAGRAPRQVLLDGARAPRVEEPERQCAQLAGVVLLRSAVRGSGVRGAGVAGGVRTALGRHAGWNSRTVHAVTPPSFTTFTLSTPSRFNERRNACNA